MTNMEYEQCIKLNLTPLQMSIRRHAAEWIKVMGEKLNDSGKEIMFALRDRLGAFSNFSLVGALFASKPLVAPTQRHYIENFSKQNWMRKWMLNLNHLKS